MDMQQGIRKRLKDSTIVSGLVGNRIDWGIRVQGSSLPAVVLQVVSDPRPAHLKDYMQVRSTNVQVDVYATTYAAAVEIARSVMQVLKTPATVSGKEFGATFVDNQRETTETLGTEIVHRQSLDLTVWHKGD
jgi:hypothetical protein